MRASKSTRAPSAIEVLNAEAAAAFLGAHVETLRRLARRGGIPSFKVGKDWRFRKEALLRWSEGQRPIAHTPQVLIVDDDSRYCRALGRLVKRAGCQPHERTSGAEALKYLAQNTPDLVLLDLVMPKMSGPAFLRLLRETHPDLPVVIVTGYPDSDLLHEAAPFAPLMLLSKPVALQQFEQTLRVIAPDRATR